MNHRFEQALGGNFGSLRRDVLPGPNHPLASVRATEAVRFFLMIAASLIAWPSLASEHTDRVSFTARRPVSLPKPAAQILVRTEGELQAAVEKIASNSALMLLPGTYVLTKPLVIGRGLQNVQLRGSSGNPGDVILKTSSPGVSPAIWVKNAHGVSISDLTLQESNDVSIFVDSLDGASLVRVSNVVFQHFQKAAIVSGNNPRGSGARFGVIEHCLFERHVQSGPYTPFISLQAAENWVIRFNDFKETWAPDVLIGTGSVILAWNGTRHTAISSNLFLNCLGAVRFGQESKIGPDHDAGYFGNNFFRRIEAPSRSPAVAAFNTPLLQVRHNTLLVDKEVSAIEIQHKGSSDVDIRWNLTNAPIFISGEADAQVRRNFTKADLSWFVSPTDGNLRLAKQPKNVADRARSAKNISHDFDGEKRPNLRASDIGADEYSSSPRLQGPPVAAVSFPEFVSLSSTVTLAATFPDTPSVSTFSYSWFRLTGPGDVRFGTPGLRITSATFTQPGVYGIRLEVSDDGLKGFTDVVIKVQSTDNCGDLTVSRFALVPDKQESATMVLDVLKRVPVKLTLKKLEESFAIPLFDGTPDPRVIEVTWNARLSNGSPAPFGAYNVELQCGEQVLKRKIVVLKRSATEP